MSPTPCARSCSNSFSPILPNRSVPGPTSASCFSSTMPAGMARRTWPCPMASTLFSNPPTAPSCSRPSIFGHSSTSRSPTVASRRSRASTKPSAIAASPSASNPTRSVAAPCFTGGHVGEPGCDQPEMVWGRTAEADLRSSLRLMLHHDSRHDTGWSGAMKSAIRRFISGIAIAGFAQTALAADPGYSPEFFNPSPALYFNWGGFYFGASGGGGIADAEFGNGAFSLLSSTLVTTPLPTAVQLPSGALALSPDNTTFSSFGGFAGYNTQWESAILSLEVNYHRTSLDVSASSSVPTFAIPGSGNVAFYNVDASVGSRISLTDYATRSEEHTSELQSHSDLV